MTITRMVYYCKYCVSVMWCGDYQLMQHTIAAFQHATEAHPSWRLSVACDQKFNGTARYGCTFYCACRCISKWKLAEVSGKYPGPSETAPMHHEDSACLPNSPLFSKSLNGLDFLTIICSQAPFFQASFTSEINNRALLASDSVPVDRKSKIFIESGLAGPTTRKRRKFCPN